MLSNRVKETGTGTTGNITLSGAVTGFQTFNNAFGNDTDNIGKKFFYFIEDSGGALWETGIGYLSTATTLVRETVLDNSSGTTSTITLSGSAHTLFCGNTKANSYSTVNGFDSGAIVDTAAIRSGAIGGGGSTHTLTADRIYYSGFYNEYAGNIDGLGGIFTTNPASANIMFGLYDVGTDGLPNNLIVSTTAAAQGGTALQTQSITSQTLPIGWMWAAVWGAGTPTIRAPNWQYSSNIPTMGLNYEGRMTGALYIDSQGSLTTFANTAVAPDSTLSGNYPMLVLEAV